MGAKLLFINYDYFSSASLHINQYFIISLIDKEFQMQNAFENSYWVSETVLENTALENANVYSIRSNISMYQQV